MPDSLPPLRGVPPIIDGVNQGRVSSYIIAIEDVLAAWETVNGSIKKDRKAITSIHQLAIELAPILLRGMFERVELPSRDSATGDYDRRTAQGLMEDEMEIAAALEALRRVFPNINIEVADITLASFVSDEDFRKRMEEIFEVINK